MKSPYNVIIAPIITEQSMNDSTLNKYTFKVDASANKAEIKSAVEAVFEGVKVASVNTMNRRGKQRRVGYKTTKRPDWKKAVVTLTSDSKNIEFFEAM